MNRPLIHGASLHSGMRSRDGGRLVRRSAKILLAGLGLSSLVLAVSYMNTWRLERRLSALQAECQQQEAPNTRASADQKVVPHFVPDTSEDYFVPPDKVPADANVFDQFDNPPPKWALDYVRANYPQYNDLSDEELGRKLHGKYNGPAWRRAPLICDANKLTSILDNNGKLVGIQAKIVEADSVARNSRSWPLSVALTLFVLSAMPWLWYALLRRIGELRAAIGGNPPEA
jgi:hypothetical protein